MNKIKLFTVVGTRPEIIRLSRVISKFDKYFNHILIHTGQNYDYELDKIFFDDLEIRKPDYYLKTSKNNPINTIADIITKIDKLLKLHKPDVFFVLGDTNSSISVYPAKRRRIPIFHYEAGNRCFDERVPEEINRKIVDHVSDINLTYSEISKQYLISEGKDKDKVINIGSPMFEVINHYREKISKSLILKKLKLEKYKYFVMSVHREENIENNENFSKIIKILNYIPKKYNLPLIVTVHPRTRNKLKKNNHKFNKLINFLKPLSFSDYLKLQDNSFCVMSDSGTISEESSILNFPAINLRDSHERPEAMEEGTVIMAGLEINIIENSIKVLKNQKRGTTRNIEIVKDYSYNNISEKIVRIVFSYINYINKKVWYKKI